MKVRGDFEGHPLETATFSFSDTRQLNGRIIRIIKSHVAYDARWPWWRRL